MRIDFTLRPKDCPEVTFNNSVILHSREAKYLGLLLNRRLTWSSHLKSKRKQLNSCLHLIWSLLKSNMNMSNRLLLYKNFQTNLILRHCSLRHCQTLKYQNNSSVSIHLPPYAPQSLLIRHKRRPSRRPQSFTR